MRTTQVVTSMRRTMSTQCVLVCELQTAIKLHDALDISIRPDSL